jgi:PKD repeat protein
MKLPVILAISVVAVLASSLMLTGVFSLDSIILSTGHDNNHVQEAGAQGLPFEVRDHFSEKKIAGDANNIKVNEDVIYPEKHCEFCTFVEYRPGPRGVAGFAYENDAGVDLTGAKKVRFWMMGEEGNEKIKFKIAGKSLDKSPDNIQDRPPNRPTNSIFESERFALTTEEVTLANDWRRYEVDLSGVSLDDITHPFGFELSKGNGAQKQVIYIKGLVFDDEPVEEQYALATVEEDEEVITQQPLTVQIISNGTQGVAPATFEFQANLTGGTEPYTYVWNFGDGSSEESNEQTVSHTFDEAGTYNVTLAATDTDNQTASDSIEINVEAAPSPPTTITEPLTAEIISNSTEGFAPATFEFEANITGGREPYTISWDFDDDSEGSDEQNVVHTFDEAGTYNVTLSVTDSEDQTASDSVEILVEEGTGMDEENEAVQEQAVEGEQVVEEPGADQSNRGNENNARAANSTSQ